MNGPALGLTLATPSYIKANSDSTFLFRSTLAEGLKAAKKKFRFFSFRESINLVILFYILGFNIGALIWGIEPAKPLKAPMCTRPMYRPYLHKFYARFQRFLLDC